MQRGPLSDLIGEQIDEMTAKLRTAAQFILDHPKEVALVSMREQARKAGVSHSTMGRLATWLGFDGYEQVRSLYAKALREANHSPTVSDTPAGMWAENNDCSASARIAKTIVARVVPLGEQSNLVDAASVSQILAASRRLFCLAQGPELAVAHHFARITAAVGKRVTVLDATDKAGAVSLRGAGFGDAILAVGLASPAREAIDGARYASRRGVAIVAITHSQASALAGLASASMMVGSVPRSFFQSITPTVAAMEILAMLIAEGLGANGRNTPTPEERPHADHMLQIFEPPQVATTQRSVVKVEHASRSGRFNVAQLGR